MNYDILEDFYKAVENLSNRGLIKSSDDPRRLVIGYSLKTDDGGPGDSCCEIALIYVKASCPSKYREIVRSTASRAAYADELNGKFMIKVINEVLL